GSRAVQRRFANGYANPPENVQGGDAIYKDVTQYSEGRQWQGRDVDTPMRRRLGSARMAELGLGPEPPLRRAPPVPSLRARCSGWASSLNPLRWMQRAGAWMKGPNALFPVAFGLHVYNDGFGTTMRNTGIGLGLLGAGKLTRMGASRPAASSAPFLVRQG